MVGKFLLGMISGGIVVAGGLAISSSVLPLPAANDNAAMPETGATPIVAPDATKADAGPAEEPNAVASDDAPDAAEAEVAEVVTEAAPEATTEIAPVTETAETEAAETQPAVAATDPAPLAPEPEASPPAEAVALSPTEVTAPETTTTPAKPAETAADVAAAVPETALPAPAAADEAPTAEPVATAEAVESPAPEAVAEAAPEAVADATPEAVAETAPEAVAETAPEVVAETVPEAVAETVPEVVAEVAPEVTVPTAEVAPPTETAEAATEATPELEVAEAEVPVPALPEPEVAPMPAQVAEAPAAEVPVETAEAEVTPPAADPIPAMIAPAQEDVTVNMPGTQPDAMPGTPEPELETAAPAIAASGSTFTPAPRLIDQGEGVIVGRDSEDAATDLAVDPAVDPNAPAEDARPIARFAATFDNPDAKPPMAIVLIDRGPAELDRAGLAALPFPVSFALDPLDPATPERAALYRAAGREVVMLVTGIAQGAQASDVEVAFQSMEQGLPEAVAAMDLAEPAFQNNRGLAGAIVPILKAQGRGLVTWDAGLNAADQVARREDLEAAMVFRDLGTAGQDKVAMRRLLDRAVFKAGQDGSVSVVGEANPETVAALLEWSVEGKAATVALAPVTAVLKVD
jgi:uncharacterized protein